MYNLIFLDLITYMYMLVYLLYAYRWLKDIGFFRAMVNVPEPWCLGARTGARVLFSSSV